MMFFFFFFALPGSREILVFSWREKLLDRDGGREAPYIERKKCFSQSLSG